MLNRTEENSSISEESENVDKSSIIEEKEDISVNNQVEQREEIEEMLNNKYSVFNALSKDLSLLIIHRY